MTQDDLLDAIADLAHDLGKYLCLPLAVLQENAGQDAVREALRRALRETRKSDRGVVTAGELWRGFVGEAGADLGKSAAYRDLKGAVDRALEWDEKLAGTGSIDRDKAERDLVAVADAIRRLLDEVRHAE